MDSVGSRPLTETEWHGPPDRRVMSKKEIAMTLASRPMRIVLLEITYFLFVLHLGGSPLGTEIPATAAAVGLVAGLIVIPVLMRRSSNPLAESVAVTGVAALSIASGAAALAMASANPQSDVGIICLGSIIVAPTLARLRPSRA